MKTPNSAAMVQTRAQTRNGAPAPSTIEPFQMAVVNNTINNPSRRRRERRPGRREKRPSRRERRSGRQRATKPTQIYCHPSDENGPPAREQPTNQDEPSGNSSDVHGDDTSALPKPQSMADIIAGRARDERLEVTEESAEKKAELLKEGISVLDFASERVEKGTADRKGKAGRN